ncbi:hypothetical protein ABIE35_004101 [Paenarthrobacter sp. 4246]
MTYCRPSCIPHNVVVIDDYDVYASPAGHIITDRNSRYPAWEPIAPLTNPPVAAPTAPPRVHLLSGDLWRWYMPAFPILPDTALVSAALPICCGCNRDK